MEQELVLRLNHWALQELLSAVDDEGKLSRDCVLSGEVLEEGTRVLKVGGSLRTGEEIVGALQEAVMCKETIKVVFACPWMGCLSTMVLRWPCCTILLTLLACIIIMVGGIRGIVLQTDMGTFMASDGESSSANSAFVNVLNYQRSNKGSGRRLNVVFEEGLRTLLETEEATNETWADMEPRRLQDPSQVKLYKYFGFQIVYANDFNILNQSQITTISVFEKGLRDLPEFKEVCRGAEPIKARFCQEGLSLANAVFPSLVPESSTFGSTAEPAVDSIHLDGQGAEAIPLSVAYRLLTQDGMDKAVLPTEVQGGTLDLPSFLICKDQDKSCAQWKSEGNCLPMSDYEFFMRDFCPKTCGFCDRENIVAEGINLETPAGKTLKVARSVYGFQSFCCDGNDPDISGKYQAMKERWTKMVGAVVEYINQKFNEDEIGKECCDVPIQVFYGGDTFAGYEATVALFSDLKWAGCACVFVIFYGTLHTRSPLLACVGLFFVLLSIPVAIAIFFMVADTQEVSIIYGIAIFIVVGVGSDMMFVYTDFWKLSLQHSRKPTKRVRYLHAQATTSTAASTFTTVASFLSGIITSMRALREFSFVMSLTMTLAWLLIVIVFPPLLVINERISRRIQAALLRGRTKEGARDSEESPLKARGSGSVDGSPGKKSPRSSRRVSTQGAGTMRVSKRQSHAAMVAERTTMTLANLVDPEKPGIGLLAGGNMSLKIATKIQKIRVYLVGFVLAFTVFAVLISFMNVEQDSGVPQIFFPDHPQVASLPYIAKFKAFDVADYNLQSRVGKRCSDLFQACDFYSCTMVGQRLGSASTCQCITEDTQEEQCTKYQVDVSVVGHKSYLSTPITAAQIKQMVSGMREDADVTINSGVPDSAPVEVQSLVWESGEQEVNSVQRTSSLTITVPKHFKPNCLAIPTFSQLSGTQLDEIHLTGVTSEELNQHCCAACTARGDCEFWERDVVSTHGITKCRLLHDPIDYSFGNTVGGFSARRTTPALFEDLEGVDVGRLSVSGQSEAALDERCCEACQTNADCTYWVRNTTSFSRDEPSTTTCYFRRSPQVHRANSGLRGGWACAPNQFAQSDGSCKETWACYCDTRRCANVQEITFAAPRGMLELNPPGRRLQQAKTPMWKVPPEKRVEVNIIFGIKYNIQNRLLGTSKAAKWQFLDTYRPENPWAQRTMLDICEGLPASLMVVNTRCWLSGFRDMRLANGKDFPVRSDEDFHALAIAYVKASSTGGYQSADFVLLKNGKIVATYISAFMDVRVDGPATVSVELKAAWDAYFVGLNSMTADSSVKGMWHTSSLWVRTEAEKMIVNSGAASMATNLFVVFFGVVLFTRSMVLAFIVMMLVACVTIDLLFFMVMIMGWKLGAIEVLCLNQFVGMSVDYSLHVAHEYHSCHISLDDVPEDIAEEDRPNTRHTHNKRANSFEGTMSEEGDEKFVMKASTYKKPRFQTDHHKELRKHHKATERFERARFALECMGSPLLGSAVTTIGCAMFLLPCTLAIFYKIGVVVIAVATFAVVYAVLPLPAILMIVGPCNHDFRSFLELMRQLSERCLGENDDPDVEGYFRPQLTHNKPVHKGPDVYWILNMPSRGAAAVGVPKEQIKASRTLVRATG